MSLFHAGHRPRSLGHHLARVKLDEHRGIGLEVFDGDGEAEVVEQ